MTLEHFVKTVFSAKVVKIKIHKHFSAKVVKIHFSAKVVKIKIHKLFPKFLLYTLRKKDSQLAPLKSSR